MSEISDKLVRINRWQKEYPCNSCKVKNKKNYDSCQRLIEWLKKQDADGKDTKTVSKENGL